MLSWKSVNVLAYAVLAWAAVAEANSPSSARDVIYKFSQGNTEYVGQSAAASLNFKRKFNALMFNKLREDPLKPAQRQAIILSDAHAFAAVEEILNCTEPGEIQAIRVSGCVAKPRDQFDSVIGSIEYALLQPKPPPLLLVIGNSQNEVVADAVRLAMSKSKDGPWADSDIVRAVLPAAKDAILQDPQASFDDLCDTASKLNIWNTIEAMVTTSQPIYDAVKSGALEVHGAFLDSQTGKVTFMGEHPANEQLLANRPVHVRTAKDPPVPPEEAIAMLVAGNRRYVKGNGMATKYIGGGNNKKLTELGQSPFAIILGCADSRAPPELLFDAQPGNLFVLRTAGNTMEMGTSSLLGSAEYAVGHLHSKLIVVMGHSKCGAVTAAVEAVKAKANLKSVPGSIGLVLADLHREAAEAVNELPQSSIGEMVARASELNVYATMEKIIKASPIIAEGIRNRDVQVHGSVYDIESGEVKWLGQHPQLTEIVNNPIPVHAWKYSPYMRAPAESKPLAATEIGMLRNGNMRFRSGKTTTDPRAEEPYAIVLAGSELRVPVENIFDTGRGEILVQRSMGTTLGHRKNGLLESVEYSVQRFSPKLLLVLGSSDSSVIHSALSHLDGEATSFGPTHIIHEAVGASAWGALEQTKPGASSTAILTKAGREKKRRGLTVELNALYTAEGLLRHSKIIRDAVKAKKLEVHLGILQEDTGRVDFIGKHPMQDEIIKGEANSNSLAQVEEKPNAFVTVGPARKVAPVRCLSSFMLFLLHHK